MLINKDVKGRIHSFQSLGTVDGPGIRFVAFLQGCPLRCGCCHNPDTWDTLGGKEFSAEEVVSKAEKFKAYFKDKGGITLSGGEPLMQADFACQVFRICKEKNINTCLDTSGCILNENVKNLLDYTDRILLDVKYTDNENYLKHASCSLTKVIEFLTFANSKNIPVTIRQVIIPTLNDNEENVLRLISIANKFPCVDKIELLPFKKICQVKYDHLNIPFPFGNIPTPDTKLMQELNRLIDRNFN